MYPMHEYWTPMVLLTPTFVAWKEMDFFKSYESICVQYLYHSLTFLT